MPYTTPDYSQYIAVKKINASQSGNANTSIVKSRSPYRYDGYFPLYKGVRLPPNSLLSNKFLTTSSSSPSSNILDTVYELLLLDTVGNSYTTNNLSTFTTLTNTTALPTDLIEINTLYYLSGSTWYNTSSSRTTLFASSNDGNSWSQQGVALPIGGGNDIVVIGNTIYILTSARLYSSINSGASWSQVFNFAPALFCTTFLVNGSNFLILGNRILWTITNGNTVTNKITSSGCTQPAFTNGLFYNNTYYTFGYDYDNFQIFRLSTTDLSTFTRNNITGSYIIMCVRRNPATGILVSANTNLAGGDSAIKWSSDDGLTWTNSTGSITGITYHTNINIFNRHYINRLFFNGELFIARMNNNSVHYSLDGKVWNESPKLPNGNDIALIGVKLYDNTNQLT